MALAEATLAAELEALTPTATPGLAETRLAEAYGAYMKDAAAGPPIVGAAVDSVAVPAMAAALGFTAGSSASAGAGGMRDGLAAFWAAIAGAPASFFSGALAVAPPSFGGLAGDLEDAFAANMDPDATLEDAAAAMAAAMHAATAGQGSATFPGPVTTPIA